MMPDKLSSYYLYLVLFFLIAGLAFWFKGEIEGIKGNVNESGILLAEVQQEQVLLQAELQKLRMQLAVSGADEVLPMHDGLSLNPDNPAGQSDGKFANEPVTEQSESSRSVESIDGSGDTVEEVTDFDLGKSALANGYYQVAIEHLGKVEPSDKRYLESRLDIANAYFFSQKYAEALTAYEKLLKLQPESVEALIGLANTYNRTGDKGEQIAAYTKAISLEPGKWLHYNSRGSALYQNGNYDKAMEDFIEAARLARQSKTDQALALENIGLIHLSREKWQVAFQHTSNVNNIDSKRSWNWLIRGIAALKLSYSNDAWVSFENWFKYKRPTDPFLLKQFLPEPLQELAEITPAELARLIDPPAVNGAVCVNNAQCASNYCAPGAPDNRISYCAAGNRDCAAIDKEGYKAGQKIEIEGISVRCYRPDTGPGRWTVDRSNS